MYLPGRQPKPVIQDPLRPAPEYEVSDPFRPPPEVVTGPLPVPIEPRPRPPVVEPPELPLPAPDPLAGVNAGRQMPGPAPIGGGRGTMGGITGGAPTGPPMGGGIFGQFARPQYPGPGVGRQNPNMPPGIVRAPGLATAPGLASRGMKPPGQNKYRG